MPPVMLKATLWGLVMTAALGGLIVLGSRNLAHFDAALVAYTFAILFATFGLTYRYVVWLQRPPTRLYWRRGWRAMFSRGLAPRRLARGVRRFGADLVLNRFIFKRDAMRGLAHLCIMWGSLLAAAITFPLVFGWLHFAPVPDDLTRYSAVVFGFDTFTFPVDSLIGFLLFHGLVWASFIVIIGVMLAMRRRMREGGAAALQRFGEDFLPLFLLFAVSVTGLMLTASYTWMKGAGYDFIAILHAITVIATFLWLPFGKLFHVFQRPAQLGVGLYKDLGRDGPHAACRRCGAAFTSLAHVHDLITVSAELGYDYRMPDPAPPSAGGASVEHYQWICPPCRRTSLALAQSRRWAGVRGGTSLAVPGATPPTRPPTPRYANPGRGEGPLGDEDATNFHP